MLARIQTLRGSVYLRDGAIKEDDLNEGRHESELDSWSLHMVVVDDNNDVFGCARYTPHMGRTRFCDLTVSKSAIAQCSEWGYKLEQAVEAELAQARERKLPYVELGGWALDESIRGTAAALRMGLSIYALSQEIGGAMGISTATVRHSSASILRKMGGHSFEHGGSEVPSYFDPHYDCMMEVLRFCSWAPNPRLAPWIEDVKNELRAMPVVTQEPLAQLEQPMVDYLQPAEVPLSA